MASRRNFLKSSVLVSPFLIQPAGLSFPVRNDVTKKSHLKLTLNAYSFNSPLRDGSMSVEDMLEFAASRNFDAVDLTAYYFPGYPEAPKKEYFNELKRKAFLLGLGISGTGIRTDFTMSETDEIEKHFEYIGSWIIAAAQMGAPVIRVFAGKKIEDKTAWKEAWPRVVEGLKRCCELGEKNGVTIALQNHNDYLKTPEECLNLYEEVNSKWFGLMVDIGSLRQGNPYDEIRKLAPYAVTWQIKEQVYFNNEARETNYKNIVNILNEAGYHGYVPLETLGEGDPREKVTRLMNAFTKAMKENQDL